MSVNSQNAEQEVESPIAQESPKSPETKESQNKNDESKNDESKNDESKKDENKPTEPEKKVTGKGWIIVQGGKKLNPNDKRKTYTIGKLMDNFEKRGFEMKIINASDIDIYLTNYDRKSILINDKIVAKPDFVLSRTGANTNFTTLAVFRHLERLHVPVINASEAIEKAKDKLYSLQILAQNNIPVPKTILVTFPINVKYVLKRLGLPIIIKCLSGMQGKGVFMAKTESELQLQCDLLDTLQPKTTPFIFQECMKSSLGRDIRVLVVNNRVVGAMLRDNTDSGDFRANIHRGAIGKKFKLPQKGQNIALDAAKLLGLNIAGVDLLFADDKGKKFRVCEVNSSPGFEGFEKATGINASKHVIAMVRAKTGLDPYDNDDDEDDEELDENATKKDEPKKDDVKKDDTKKEDEPKKEQNQQKSQEK